MFKLLITRLRSLEYYDRINRYESLKMSSTTAEKLQNFKSKIPVPVLKVKKFNEPEENRENGKNFPCVREPLNYKSARNPLPLPKEKSKTQLKKPPSKEINKRNEIWKNQPIRTQHSNKTLVKNSVSKVPKMKTFQETKSLNKTKKDNSPKLFKKVTVKKSVKDKTNKAKLLAEEKYQSSNASLPTCNNDLQIEGKLVLNENKVHKSSKSTLEKENQEQPVMSDFSPQKGIKFEANEIYRQMILRGRDLSPSVCRLAPGVKLSSVISRRPSAYDTVLEVHPDPHYNAVQAIEKMTAKRGNRKLTLQIEKILTSPYKVRNSLYTPGVNPEEEVMKSLKAIRDKQIQKSALKSTQKKVTFNFNTEGISSEVKLSPEKKPFANPEDKLTQINEASSENTPSSPVKNLSDTNGEEVENYLKTPKLQNLNGHSKSMKQGNAREYLESDKDSEINTLVEKYMNVLRPSETNNTIVDSVKSPFCSSKKINFISLNRNCNSKPMTEAFSCKKTIPQILSFCTDQHKRRTVEMKLCTPRPISFSSNSRLLHNSSPDFHEKRNIGNLSKLAPIYTPLVLKNIAERSAESPDNLSPVKLKLDFAASESDTPKKGSSEKMQVSSVKNIVTATKMLDNLADKECDIFLSNENFHVICGRYLQNPIALTLTEGDEMHFLPIRL